MRMYWLAALAVLGVGMISTPSAHADWRDGFGSHAMFKGDVRAARPYVAAPQAEKPVAAKPKRTANAPKKPDLVQKASLTSSAGTWAGSVGGAQLTGKASYYWQPQRVASGGWFNPNAMTAAHKTLPFGTKVEVTNLRNGKSVVVTINDRGPYIQGRIIDLSAAAAGAIDMKKSGVVPVSVTVLGK